MSKNIPLSQEPMLGPINREDHLPVHLDDVKEASNVTVILGDVIKKQDVETKAWDALSQKLSTRNIQCKKCGGSGKDISNSNSSRDDKDCYMCVGEGYLVTEPEMRAIELVMKPKFPTTNININAEIDNMSVSEIMAAIDEM